VIAAIGQPSSTDRPQRLSELCLAVSQPTWDESHCLLELDVVALPELRPWRYPPPIDFHYSRSRHEAFERGDTKPWREDESIDLAASITVLHAAGVVLAERRSRTCSRRCRLPTTARRSQATCPGASSTGTTAARTSSSACHGSGPA
jgi:hypothetical protein